MTKAMISEGDRSGVDIPERTMKAKSCVIAARGRLDHVIENWEKMTKFEYVTQMSEIIRTLRTAEFLHEDQS